MQCDICTKKKATVHLTEIIDEQITELHLCEDCARKKSVQMEQQFGLADLLAGLADFGKPQTEAEQVKITCSFCSLSYDDFRKFGRLGCSECYTSFKSHLSLLLKKIHGSNRHYGKVPIKVSKSARSARKTVDELQQLKDRLREAVEVENFEQAAEIRDKIREFENKKKEKEKK